MCYNHKYEFTFTEVDLLKMFEPADQNNGMNSFKRFFSNQAMLLYIVTSLIYIQKEKTGYETVWKERLKLMVTDIQPAPAYPSFSL